MTDPLSNPAGTGLGGFVRFELRALRLLLAPQLGEALTVALLDGISKEALVTELEINCSDYCLTVRHPLLPHGFFACDRELVTGRIGNIRVEFSAFILKGSLGLECHTVGGFPLPEAVRERDACIELPG